MTEKIICPHVKVMVTSMLRKKLIGHRKEEQIVVQCPQCNSEGEIEDVDRKTN